MRPSDQAVRDALTARGGIVSRAQLLAVDVSASAIARRVKSGELGGLPVTTRARTVLDCAGRPDAQDIRDRALQRGTTILSLETALQRMAPGHGTTAARRLVEPVRRWGVSRGR